MFSDPMTGPGSWPEPLLGVGLDRLGQTPSHAPKIRLSRSSRIFLGVVVAQSALVASLRLLTDIVWKLPATASHGLLNTEQNSWFFTCFVISACYNVLFAMDAVINESRPALFACIGSSLLLTFRSVVEFSYKESACSQESLNWVCIPGLIEVLCYQIFLVSLGLGSVITQMGFRFYRIVGADLSLREIYERYIQWVTMYRLNQQFSLLAFITALFFSNSALQIVFTVSFLMLELAWELFGVLAVHKEDLRLSRLSMILSSFTPLYSTILLVLLAGNPFFFDGLMLFKIFLLVVLNIINRVIVEILAHRLRASFGQGFRTRILPKLNLLSLALPIRCLPHTGTSYTAVVDLQLDSRASSRSSSSSSSNHSPSAADL